MMNKKDCFLYRCYFITVIGCLLSFLVLPISSQAQIKAKQVFNDLSPMLYQIRLIEKSSGQKASIGSGFQISSDGIIATNYHVISEMALSEQDYFVEFDDEKGNKGVLKLLSVDVVNDLALLQKENAQNESFLEISAIDPQIGEEIYSLGNPQDLGMIISPGIFNGIKKDSFYNRVNFTGSINSGMSGGPVVNANKEVVGVNVATAGNSLGFLVPRMALLNLYEQLEQNKFFSIETQILKSLKSNQNKLMGELLNNEWRLKPLGDGLVPADVADFIRCWGNSNNDDKTAAYKEATISCGMSENLYLSRRFRTGQVNLQYFWYDATNMDKLRFYNLYESAFSSARADNSASKDDVENFKCQTDIITKQTSKENIDSLASTEHQDMTFKAAMCARKYKNFDGLYDVLFMAATIDKEKNGLMTHFTLAGVEKDVALQFSQKFIEAFSWQ